MTEYSDIVDLIDIRVSDAYERGYNDGQKNLLKAMENDNRYDTGCEDAWKFAAKIEGMTCGKVAEIFGIEEDNSAWLCNQISYKEALQRYKEWQETKASEELVRDLANQIGIHQLYTLVKCFADNS